MKNDIVLVPYKETDGMIFCGYFEGHLLLKNGNPLLSRTHKQPYRIYHANGISQAMAASETQGRYFTMETMADKNTIELPSELKGKKFRIRKLTPRECFRLMGVDDKDIDKIQDAGISNSGQYKLAGNSIVVDVLYHIFRKMFIETDVDKNQEPQQLSLF
jgi:site-specific DNA-cytosine methylase